MVNWESLWQEPRNEAEREMSQYQFPAFPFPTVEICIPVYNILNGYTTLSFQATKRRLYGRTAHDKAKFQVSFTLLLGWHLYSIVCAYLMPK